MYTFRKEERLCSRKLLSLLFVKGSSFLLYPFRVSYILTEPGPAVPVQVVINVSKKRYKKATDRNLIKRRTREVYRLNKAEALYGKLPASDKILLLSLQFVGKDIYEASFLEKKIQQVFRKLTTNLSANGDHQ